MFDAFPYLCLSSPTPRCGKTRLLEVLELLVARAWRGLAPTEAALFRFIEQKQPTLLLDEVEGLARRNASERESGVLAILNAGYKRGQTVPRRVGNSHELQNFSVYCPKAFAAIGHLPGTLADRSIVIPMQRRAPNESVARFRFARAEKDAAPIRSAIGHVVKALGHEIKETYTDLPELPFLSDRDDEIFGPLFAVCAVLAPERLKELETSAKSLSEGKAGDTIDDSLALRLLTDMVRLCPAGKEHWATADILSALKAEYGISVGGRRGVESPAAGPDTEAVRSRAPRRSDGFRHPEGLPLRSDPSRAFSVYRPRTRDKRDRPH